MVWILLFSPDLTPKQWSILYVPPISFGLAGSNTIHMWGPSVPVIQIHTYGCAWSSEFTAQKLPKGKCSVRAHTVSPPFPPTHKITHLLQPITNWSPHIIQFFTGLCLLILWPPIPPCLRIFQSLILSWFHLILHFPILRGNLILQSLISPHLLILSFPYSQILALLQRSCRTPCWRWSPVANLDGITLQRHIDSHTQPNDPVCHSVQSGFYVDNCLQSFPTGPTDSWSAEVNSVFWRFQHLSVGQ